MWKPRAALDPCGDARTGLVGRSSFSCARENRVCVDAASDEAGMYASRADSHKRTQESTRYTSCQGGDKTPYTPSTVGVAVVVVAYLRSMIHRPRPGPRTQA